MYIALPNKGAIWIERWNRPQTDGWKPEIEKDAGEYVIWWQRLQIIFTPPGWKHQRALVGTP
jgi:hypothetical protein